MLRCDAAVRADRGATRAARSPPLLEIYNTLARRSELFEPLEDGLVRMYVCGITPYDVGHLGHALVYVFFDTVRRYLEFQSFEVRHIQNITDVDDDMVRVSRQLEVGIAELTEQNHAQYLREMDSLNVMRPQAFPLASASMPEIIALIEVLLDGGHAYLADGHVLFDAAGKPEFGALSGKTPDELRSGPRTDTMPAEPEQLKRDPLDFVLWQPSDAAGASFASPWSAGRPGWHIECSAMARASLGDRIDIHGGGQDLIYPHHESEIVQSQCATGATPFARYWMHVGTVTLDGEKMSKSLGNLVKVSELLDRGHTPDAIRLMLLGRHYRDEHPWDPEELARYEELAGRLRRASESPGGPPDQLRVQPLRNAFMDAMDDDFDTPQAIEVLDSVASGIEAGALHGATAVPTLAELSGVLGLRLGRED
jgi:cysteinyl-tRNA synthetase